MVELHHVFVLLYAITAALSVAVLVLALRRRAARGALSLTVLMLGIAVWSGASAAMWYVPTLGEQVFWLRATFLGVCLVPIAVVGLAFDVAGARRWRTPIHALMVTVALASVSVAWLNPGHLYDAAFVATAIGPYTHYEPTPGPLYIAYNVFAFTTIIAGLAIVFRAWVRSSGAERTQAGVVFMGGLVPLISAAVTESRLVPLSGLDLAPLAFLATGALWGAAILRGTLLEIVLVARDALVEQMIDGVLVVDAEDRIVDANPAALTMMHQSSAEVLGKPARAMPGSAEGATAVLGGSGPKPAVLAVDSDGDSRDIEVRITPLVVGPGRAPARLVKLRDVTEEKRANERLELAAAVFDTMSEGILVVTPPGPVRRILDVNDSLCRMTGRSKEDLVGKDMSCIQSGRHLPEYFRAIEQALSATGEWRGELWHTRADGTEFPSWMSVSVAKDDRGDERYAVGVFTDVTGVKEAERVLESEGLYRALTELTPDPVFVVDADMRIALANSAAARFLGDTCEQLKGARVGELFGSIGGRLEGHLSQVAATGRPFESEECFTAGESEVCLKMSLVSLSDVAPGLVLGVSRDVTDSKRLELALREHADEEERMATHDALTGLANRRAFLASLDRAIALVRRGTPSAVFFIDVDCFKRCNDERGHAFGDEVLISVARLLEKEVREVDLVARIGGDEFAALLAGSTVAEASVVEKRMKASIEALGDRIGVPIGLSVGVVSVGADASVDEIISTADQRMYEDKADVGGAREAAKGT